jgi:hypothetical protein
MGLCDLEIPEHRMIKSDCRIVSLRSRTRKRIAEVFSCYFTQWERIPASKFPFFFKQYPRTHRFQIAYTLDKVSHLKASRVQTEDFEETVDHETIWL